MSLNVGAFGVNPDEDRVKVLVCFIVYSEAFCFYRAESERENKCFFSAIGVFFYIFINLFKFL